MQLLRRRHLWLKCSITLLLVLFFGLDLDAEEIQPDPSITENSSVDVERQVWPLLRNHCLRCHGPEREDGGFRVDTISHIRDGGHTGLPILGEPREGRAIEGEFMKRLRSDDPQYRMPKERLPLPEHEIELLETWIRDGANWPAGGVIRSATLVQSSATAKPLSIWQRLNQWMSNRFDEIIAVRERIKLLQWPAILFLIVIFGLERRKKQLKAIDHGDGSTKRLSLLDRIAVNALAANYLNGLLVIVIGGFVLYILSAPTDRSSFNQARSTVNRSSGSAVASPAPYRPHHPRRLGGVYYRGNDERSKALFNGGYYRTATMILSLRDESNRELRWGDQCSGDLFITVEIQRAPFATPALFTDEIMNNCWLSMAASQVTDSATKLDKARAFFSEVEDGERWIASYPIGSPNRLDDVPADASEWKSGRLVGRVDVVSSGWVHFAILFDLTQIDGRIDSGSDLWMGAVVKPSNFVIPSEGTILVTEWFDFLPIPEITEPNSLDPLLLGIPEHAPDVPSHQ